jgi:hypothetical protein
MEAALIGLVGVLVGALLAEHFRRSNRIEAYAQKIFERRLEVYEGLMKLVQEAYATADATLDEGMSKEERHSLLSGAILAIAQYTDENALFIDHYIAADATAMAMSADGIPEITDEVERATAISNFRSHYKATKQNILEESGVRQINEHFKLVSRSRPSSPVITRMKELEKYGA